MQRLIQMNMKQNNNFFYKILSICLVICMIAGMFSGCGKLFRNNEPTETMGATEIALETEVGTEEPTQSVQEELSVTDLLMTVMSMKSELEAVLEDIKEDNPTGARERIDVVSQNAQAVCASLEASIANLGDSAVGLQGQLTNIQNMAELVHLLAEKLLKPVIAQIEAYPATGMKTEEGLNTKWLGQYLDFAESIMPNVEELLLLASEVDLSLVDGDGKLADYLEKANELLELYHTDKSFFSKMKAIFGAEGDRTYLVAIQNSAEIRSSGGFPGSMGVLRIQNGIMKLDAFDKVYDVLAYTVSQKKVNITSEEKRLFDYHDGMNAPRDADHCPDFERVAFIWAVGYEERQKEQIDGVISMTPCIVQSLLTVLNEEIKLSDGLLLTKDNATKVLQHDIYFKYYANGRTDGANIITDRLFAEAAEKTMQLMTEKIQFAHLTDLLLLAKDSFEDRTLMMWMKDEAEQETVVNLGWHAGLNKDPQNPQAGVYYSCAIASKMGYFLIMNTEMGERIKNDDGSYTYPITVTFSNSITQQEIKESRNIKSITGNYGGTIVGFATFFAPAGGTVSDFTVSGDRKIRMETYNDLQLGYMPLFNIYPDEVVTVTYNVTTAAGVETQLVFSKTPTVQDYH